MPRWPLLSLTLPLVLAAAACDRQSGDKAQQPQAAASAAPAEDAEALNGVLDRSFAGQAMPKVTVEGANGIKLDLTSLKGAPILLNLWATWCAPCVKEMPTLDLLAKDPAIPRILAVSEDPKGAAVVNPFLQQHQFLHLQTWLDPKTDLTYAIGGAASLPTTILYGADGKEIWRVVGGYDWSSVKARALIAEAKAKA